jgi:ClpP class serine protease
MSAATMLACSANKIVMGKHSFLGPIDPQFIIQTELGRASVAAWLTIQSSRATRDLSIGSKPEALV